MTNKFFLYIFILTASFYACAQKKAPSTEANPLSSYDFTSPEVFELPSVLQEISGISFIGNAFPMLISQQDERGSVFLHDRTISKTTEVQFGQQNDYEDIATLNNRIYVLESNGNIHSFILSSDSNNKKIATQYKQHQLSIAPGEYEGLASLSHKNQLVLLCKSCTNDKKQEQTTGYLIDVSSDQQLSINSQFSIDWKAIETISKSLKKAFRPSALTWNNTSQQWYVLSSVNKMLVVMNAAWEVKKVYPLTAKHFVQPEGITFDEAQNLYIASEGKDNKKGTIMKFQFKENE